MVDSEEEKQNYLRENILDKGYEAEDFVTYLTSKKGDEGVDLGNWQLNELKAVVQEYILSHPKNNSNEINNNIQPQLQIQPNFPQNPLMQFPNMNMIPNANMNNNINAYNNMNTGMNQNINNPLMNMNMNQNIGMNMNPNINMPMNMTQNMNMDMNMNQNMNINMNNNIINNNSNAEQNKAYIPQYGVINEPEEKADVYGITNLDTILCSISEKSLLSKYENVKIEMTLGEKVAGTFFTKAYMTYIITTSPLNLKVRRRYSDFEWFRQILLNFYSSSLIPPIPKKNKIGGDRFDETFLVKRMRTLEKFLNMLMEDPVIRVSQILYDFLSIEEEDKFAEKKKTYNNFRLPLYLRDYKSPNGKLDISLNEEKEMVYQTIKDHTELNQDLLSKLNKNLKMLNTEMNAVINRMDEISKNCEELFLNSFKYGDEDEIKISYYQLNDMFKHWSTALKKNAALINIDVREYFKYSKNTFRSMKELLNVVDNCKMNYYKSKRNLITKKEELFKKSDVSKWDLGPNQGTSIVDLLKDKNFALPKMLCNETSAVINLKQIYGYYLNRATKEFERISKITNFGHRQNVTDGAKKQITIISELFRNISEVVAGSDKYDIKNIEKTISNDYNKKDQGNNNNKI